jgi:hypothetical protein
MNYRSMVVSLMRLSASIDVIAITKERKVKALAFRLCMIKSSSNNFLRLVNFRNDYLCLIQSQLDSVEI